MIWLFVSIRTNRNDKESLSTLSTKAQSGNSVHGERLLQGYEIVATPGCWTKAARCFLADRLSPAVTVPRSLSISLHWGWVKLSFHTLGMALLSPSPKQCFRPHWPHCLSGKNWNHWSVSDRNFALGYSRLFVSSCTPGVSSLATAAKSLDFIPGAELNELSTCQFCVPSISGLYSDSFWFSMIHFFCFTVCHSFHSAVAKLVGDHCLKFARKSDGRFMHIMRALATCCSLFIYIVCMYVCMYLCLPHTYLSYMISRYPYHLYSFISSL